MGQYIFYTINVAKSNQSVLDTYISTSTLYNTRNKKYITTTSYNSKYY